MDGSLFQAMAIIIIPTLVRFFALRPRFLQNFLFLKFDLPEPPYIVVHRLRKSPRLRGDILNYKRFLFLRPVQDNAAFFQPYPATGQNIALKADILDKLLTHAAAVFYLVQLVSAFRLAQNISRTIVPVIGKGRLTDNRRTVPQAFLRFFTICVMSSLPFSL